MRIVFAGHPIGQRLARIVIGRQIQGARAETGGFYRLPGLLVGGGGHRAPGENHFVARFRPGFMAYLREKRGKAVVILLAPFLEGVMVALGALHSSAEEELRGVFEFGLWIAHALVPDDSGIVLKVARRGEDFAHKAIVGFVLEQTVANPRVEGVGAAGLFGVGTSVAEQRAPFVGEIVGVIGAVEQTVDKGVARGLAA